MSLSATVQKRSRQHFATKKMSAEVRGQILYVGFLHGKSNSWPLPEKSDKAGIRIVLEKAVVFAKQNGASHGQEEAVRKALTSAEYWLKK